MPHTEDKSASRNQEAITLIKKNTFLICFSYLPIIWWCLLIHLVWRIHCKSRSASEIMKITPPNQTSIFHRLELSDKQAATFTGSLPFCLLIVCFPRIWLSNTVLGSHAHITVMYRYDYYLYTFLRICNLGYNSVMRTREIAPLTTMLQRLQAHLCSSVLSVLRCLPCLVWEKLRNNPANFHSHTEKMRAKAENKTLTLAFTYFNRR